MNPRVMRMIKKSHIVLEVIDIRRPGDTKSKMLEDYLIKRKKPFIKIFNKADLVPKAFAEKVVSDMGGVYISSREKHGLKKVRNKIKQTLGGRKEAVIAVVGYPNTGKSSLINCLKGRKSAGVGPIPGHTKGEQLIRMDKNIMLIDTPGVMTSEPRETLAAKGAIAGERIKNPELAVGFILKNMMKHNKGVISEMYKVEEIEPLQIMEDLCKKRGWKTTERAARKILQDWNSGKLKGYWY